jgi:hypothetical protein
MPYKRTGKTGPLPPLWSEDGNEAARNAHEKRKRANKEAYQYRDDESLDSRPEGPASDYAKEVTDLSHESSIPSRIQSWLFTGSPWRLWIAFAAAFLLLSDIADRGWIPGVDALATEASVIQLHAQYMEAQVLELKRAACLGTSRQSKAFYVNRMNQVEFRYRDVTGNHPKGRPTCASLGVPDLPIDAR